MCNPVQPQPCPILGLRRESAHEWTFRVAADARPQHGQFMQLSIPQVGEAPISVSAQGDGWREFTIRSVGRVTNVIFQKRPGDLLFLRGPYGKGWPVEELRGKHLVVLTGGTGLVPSFVPELPFESFAGDYAVLVVGPPPMMKFTGLALMDRGVNPEKVWMSFERKMSCAVGKCGHCRIDEVYVCLDGPVFPYAVARDLVD